MGRNQKTAFHTCLHSLSVKHGYNITGLCKITGIPYQTMRKRLNNPRGLRWYEYLGIVNELYLNKDEEAELQEAIKAF